MCEMSEKMMREMEMMKEDVKILRGKISAMAKYLKMDFKYTPEEYEMVKPEELAKEGQMPMTVR
jgi:hypothetical protein